MHQAMAAAMEHCVVEIRRLQEEAPAVVALDASRGRSGVAAGAWLARSLLSETLGIMERASRSSYIFVAGAREYSVASQLDYSAEQLRLLLPRPPMNDPRSL